MKENEYPKWRPLCERNFRKPWDREGGIFKQLQAGSAHDLRDQEGAGREFERGWLKG
jgi:hypothetical protein